VNRATKRHKKDEEQKIKGPIVLAVFLTLQTLTLADISWMAGDWETAPEGSKAVTFAYRRMK
jgi:hypothetical protein